MMNGFGSLLPSFYEAGRSSEWFSIMTMEGPTTLAAPATVTMEQEVNGTTTEAMNGPAQSPDVVSIPSFIRKTDALEITVSGSWG